MLQQQFGQIEQIFPGVEIPSEGLLLTELPHLVLKSTSGNLRPTWHVQVACPSVPVAFHPVEIFSSTDFFPGPPAPALRQLDLTPDLLKQPQKWGWQW